MKSRWLRAVMLLATASSEILAWTPPIQPLEFTTQLTRTRRHSSNVKDNTQYFHIYGWHLELEENKSIRSPFYDGCKFFKGRIIDEKNSTAMVTECEGHLYGLLQVDGEAFVLEPNKRREKKTHVLRRRDVLLSETPAAYNLTGDTVTDLELDFDEDEPAASMHVHPRHNDHSDVEYFRNALPVVTKPATGEKGLWLEIAIVADHTMLKFHGRDRVKHYILALMNIVSAIFNDPSLSANITLVINKLYLYEERDPVIRYGNVKKSLEAVNKWNYRHLNKLPPESTGWDAAVWLTRAQLGGPSGFAPVGGVCSNIRSAAINRDEGLTSAFVIAHELAHLLGLTHDGDGQCDLEAQRGSVMAPTVFATLHNYVWSSCSKRQFDEKVKGWWCLYERSKDDGVVLGGARELSNYVFTMEEQCRTEFGEGFSVCKPGKLKSACSRLWCAHRSLPHVCRSKRAPPMEGTPCGHNHWCVDQVCEPMPGHRIENRVESQQSAPRWGEWGEWSSCSAGCGYGLRTRTRHCRNNGVVSEECEGAGSQVSACWAGNACAALRDMRTDVCYRHDRRLISYVHPNESKECETWCVDFEGGDPTAHGALPDGTPCSYTRPYDICYQGTCVKGQCNTSDPSCNWCPDGYCSNYTHIYHRQLGKGWSRMAIIPHDAHEMSVHISTPLPLYIAIRERRRERHILELSKLHSKRFEVEDQDKYLKYDPSVPQNLQIIEIDSNVIDIKEGWLGEAVAAGTVVRWNQTDSNVFITSTSQLQTDMMIMAIPERGMSISIEPATVQVSVNYSMPAGRARPLEYRFSSERGPCSVSCGGGLRAVRSRCSGSARDSRDGCQTRYERCNVHRCEFTWKAGEWEECSATCGDHGVQERQLFCVPLNISTSSRSELVSNSVSPALCTSEKPDREQPCNRHHCPVYWKELPWTPCSVTCGRGRSHRPLVCPATHDEYCGPRPRERHRNCRARRCPTPRASPAPCPVDTSRYCDIFNREQLTRNCAVPRFRKYCCDACKYVDSGG